MNWKELLKKIRKFAYKAIPLWLVLFIFINTVFGVGFGEYIILRNNFNQQLAALGQTTKDPNQLAQILKQEVLPQKGYTLGVTWGDIGKQLLATGVIDKQKFDELFAQDPSAQKMMKYLSQDSKDHMMINESNSHFMVNTLWAFGLVNKNDILDNGEMKTYGQGDPMGYASTGGWTMGSKPTSELYSSAPLIQLTDEQEALVKKIAATIYRPCCGNSVAFPDCNHGMAALGYIEIAVKQGLSEKRIYQDVLALNSYWFPQQYVNMAAYFKQQKIEWKNVDPKMALSRDYSSAQGAQRIQQAIQGNNVNVSGGGGCGS